MSIRKQIGPSLTLGEKGQVMLTFADVFAQNELTDAHVRFADEVARAATIVEEFDETDHSAVVPRASSMRQFGAIQTRMLTGVTSGLYWLERRTSNINRLDQTNI